MVIFNDNVKTLCEKVCDELGSDRKRWEVHRKMVEDWLVTEAFSRVRSQYWSDQHRKLKVEVAVVEDGGNKMS